MKRLEAGLFHFNARQGEKQALTWTQLKLILEGMQLEKLTSKKRYLLGT